MKVDVNKRVCMSVCNNIMCKECVKFILRERKKSVNVFDSVHSSPAVWQSCSLCAIDQTEARAMLWIKKKMHKQCWKYHQRDKFIHKTTFEKANNIFSNTLTMAHPRKYKECRVHKMNTYSHAHINNHVISLCFSFIISFILPSSLSPIYSFHFFSLFPFFYLVVFLWPGFHPSLLSLFWIFLRFLLI